MRSILAPLAVLFALAPARADGPDPAIAPAPGLDWPVLGRVRARAASEIRSSSWSIGGETLDRDYADYEKYKAYLGPLGAKRIRFQAGWAKCEKERGRYDWAWLDRIVDDARAQGVQPWLELSYGNPLYPGGGGTGLGGGLPSSPEALDAWDAWVRAAVRHFRDRVTEWAVWNEPDMNQGNAPEALADFHARTAAIVRAEQPGAKLIALSIANPYNRAYIDRFFARLQETGRLDLVDVLGFHGYPRNPDDVAIARLREQVAKFKPGLALFQNETGCPSSGDTFGALRDLPWTEQTQAKWNLRRMLAHHGAGVPFNLFTLMDLHYKQDGGIKVNRKGLLESRPDGSVARRKPTYYAAQHVFAIFDDALRPDPAGLPAPLPDRTVAAHAFRTEDGRRAVALWYRDAVPADDTPVRPVDLTLPFTLADPVLVDLRTGAVHAIPPASLAREGGSLRLTAVPVYDSPVVLAERSLVPMAVAR